MRLLSRLLPFLLLCLVLAAHAQDAAAPPPSATPEQALDQLQSQLDGVKAALKGKSTDAELGDLRNDALAVQVQADALVAELKPRMDSLDARLAVLGPAPAAGVPAEAAEVAAQRRQLNKDKSNLDAQIKQAQLLGEEGLQLASQVAAMRRDQFQARLASRTATPFSRAFWVDPARALPADIGRLRRLGGHFADSWRDAWQPPGRLPLLACLLLAVAALLAVRRLLERGLFALIKRTLPEGHLRRSVLAIGVALAGAVGVGLAGQLAYLGLDWTGTLGDELGELAHAAIRLVVFAAYVAGLGRALLSVEHPSWRLPTLSNAAAERMRPFPLLLAVAIAVLGLFERVNTAIGASLPATVTTRGLVALAISGLFGAALHRLTRLRRAMLARGEEPPPRPLWVGLLFGAAVLGVVLSWLGVVTGFIAFGSFVATQMLWIGVVAGTLYLLAQLLGDLLETLLSPRGRSGQRLQAAFELAPATLEQAATVLTGVVNVLLWLVAIVAVLAPYGASPQDLLVRVTQLFGGLRLGELTIRPGTLLGALAVFVAGMFAVRGLKRWLGNQLLPKTELDPGMQNSIVTLLGYAGGVLVFALALAALNVSLQSIAWIASALSVGIGFGLQAIVQNFISGLILLAERPVKVGDWISIPGAEGDIRRINVRATEIQLADRSTVIVPNSQLITQNVRNVTLGRAQGRVQFRLPMPLDTDADKARQIMLDTLRAHPSLLEAAGCTVQLDSVDGGSMVFVLTGYVGNPRDAGNVKSDLLFKVLARLREAGLPLIRPQDMVLHRPPAPAAAPAPGGDGGS